MSRFANRAIYVTGGGTGIGRAIAVRLAAEGGAVAVSDIEVANARAVADEIAAAGGTAFATGCDVRDDAAVRTSIADAISASSTSSSPPPAATGTNLPRSRK
jgi:3-oxoacyl-[acyl-carrier protein] reductase